VALFVEYIPMLGLDRQCGSERDWLFDLREKGPARLLTGFQRDLSPAIDTLAGSLT